MSVLPRIAPEAQIGSYSPFSCISYVKARRPDLTEPWGTPYLYAQSHELSQVPTVGAVGISREGPVWHAWLVEEVPSGSVGFSECNFISGKCGTRTLPVDSQLIVGYVPL